MAVMRAKMQITKIDRYDSTESVSFCAVGRSELYPDDGSDEDNTYAKFTPQGDLSMTIANPALLGKLNVGDTFYLDFTKVE